MQPSSGDNAEAPAIEQTDVSGSIRRAVRLSALRGSQYFFLFLASLVVARALGPELRAQYALPVALSGAIYTLVHLSLDGAALRVLARQEASLADVTRLSTMAILVLGALGVAITTGVGAVSGDGLLAGASLTTVFLAGLMVPVGLGQQLLSGLLARVGALRAYGWASASCAVLVLAFDGLLIATSNLTPASAIGAIVLGGSCLDITLLLALGRHTGARALLPGGPRRVASMMVRAGATLHPAAIAAFLTMRIDIFLVSLLASDREVGLYSLAATLTELVVLGSWTLAHAAVQTQTDAPSDVAAQYTAEFLRRSSVLVAAGATVLAALAYPAIEVLYGAEWTGTVLPFVILCFGAIAFALERPARILIVRLARPSIVVVPAVIGTVTNVILNLALIPLLGITGAAIASFVSYWLYALLILRRFSRVTGIPMRAVFLRSA